MSEITLKIGGQLCQLGIKRLRIQQQINEIPAAQIELLIPTDNRGLSDKAIQAEISRIATGAALVVELDKKALFTGYLTQKKMILQGKFWSARLEARHGLQKLAFLPHSRVFRQQDDAAIFNTLFRQSGVKLSQGAGAQLNTKHDQLVQFRISDWYFIRHRLLSTNCWLLPEAASSSATIAPLTTPATASHTLDYHDAQSRYTLYEVNLNFDNRFIADSMTLQGWDVAQQQLTPAQASRPESFHPWKSESGNSQPAPTAWKQDFHLAFSNQPESPLNTLSRSWLNHLQLSAVQGYIILEGTRDFQPGQSIKLNGFDAGLDGTALLNGVNQLFDSEQGWRSELTIGMPATLPETVPGVSSLHIATVAAFSADPQHQDRIPVTLPALNLPGETLFARLSKPWASKASGFCFYPEPGDEVVVGFIESDPRYPIILGSLHNPKNSAPFPPDEKNNRKGVVVKGENNSESLLFDTQEKTLTLAAGENTFSLADEGNITFDSPESLQVTAKEKLTLSAQSQVEITSAKINMKQ